jgi:hypothetical protein
MTGTSAFRCAVAAEARGDSMIGTAPPQARVLLVHQPGPWGPRGLVESRADPDVAHRIDVAAANAGMRLQAIRRPGKHYAAAPPGGYDVGIADTHRGAATLTWWLYNDLAELAFDLEVGGPQRPPIAIDTAPVYFVCAHGRHDACCALRGRPIAQALQQIRPGRAWETTHLGGDRFAANVLVLPTGELYGRMIATNVPELVERSEAGEVLPSLLRGRIGIAPIVQAAIVYAHQQLGIAARDALVATSVTRIDADGALVALATPRGTFDVTVLSEAGPAVQLTCRGPQGVRAREWRGTQIASAG